MRAALARTRWRTRLFVAVTIIVVGSATGYCVATLGAGALQAGGETGWWYPQDYQREVDTSTVAGMQSTVPVRPGQRQGFLIDVYNPSDWSQTVVGLVDDWQLSPGGSPAQLGVATTGGPNDAGVGVRTDRYRLPEVIPPHQYRAMRVLWTNAPCLPGGGTQFFNEFVLTVRVGIFDRTETLSTADWAFALTSPGSGTCP
jgi:hypothetical protein